MKFEFSIIRRKNERPRKNVLSMPVSMAFSCDVFDFVDYSVSRGNTCCTNCDSIKSNCRSQRSPVADKTEYRCPARDNDASLRAKKFMNGQDVSPPSLLHHDIALFLTLFLPPTFYKQRSWIDTIISYPAYNCLGSRFEASYSAVLFFPLMFSFVELSFAYCCRVRIPSLPANEKITPSLSIHLKNNCEKGPIVKGHCAAIEPRDRRHRLGYWSSVIVYIHD